MKEKFYSDYGKRCICGGTIHRYELDMTFLRSDWNCKIETFCYSCHATSAFYVPHWTNRPDNPTEAAFLHRKS